MNRKNLFFIFAIFMLFEVFVLSAHAAAVGRFTLIKGQVDVLKGGKVPAIPAKVQDGVDTGDVIRTKSGAKAQLSMVDDSVITLAPESRLAIADYQYNPARQERRALLRLFRGLVYTVVSRIIKTEEPDFLMETHTATIGVRGTKWYTLLGPNATGVYLPQGNLGVSSNLRTVPALARLKSGQFLKTMRGLPPSLPQVLTPEILRMLERMMDTGVTGDLLGLDLPASGEGLALPYNPDQKLLQQIIPPVLQPQHQVAPPPPVQPSAPVQPGSPTGPTGPSPSPIP